MVTKSSSNNVSWLLSIQPFHSSFNVHRPTSFARSITSSENVGIRLGSLWTTQKSVGAKGRLALYWLQLSGVSLHSRCERLTPGTHRCSRTCWSVSALSGCKITATQHSGWWWRDIIHRSFPLTLTCSRARRGDVGAAPRSEEKLRPCVSLYLMDLFPSGPTVQCWTSPKGCTIAPGIYVTMLIGSGKEKPCRSLLASSLPTWSLQDILCQYLPDLVLFGLSQLAVPSDRHYRQFLFGRSKLTVEHIVHSLQ